MKFLAKGSWMYKCPRDITVHSTKSGPKKAHPAADWSIRFSTPRQSRGEDSSHKKIGDSPRLDSPKDNYATRGVPAASQGDVVVEANLGFTATAAGAQQAARTDDGIALITATEVQTGGQLAEPRLELRICGRGSTAERALRANFGRDGGENRDGRHRRGPRGDDNFFSDHLCLRQVFANRTRRGLIDPTRRYLKTVVERVHRSVGHHLMPASRETVKAGTE
jgi:hypothetical protein